MTPPSAPATSGPLHVVLHDRLPVTGTAAQQPIAAEAPDGSVFVTMGTSQQDGPAQAPAGSVIYVVDGTSAVAVAEHSATAVTALAADATSLYAGGTSQVVSISRATGAVTRTWNVGQPVRLLAASAGRVWAVLGGVSAAGAIVEINPASSGFSTVATSATSVASVAAGPQGLYYVASGGATIVHISADGTQQQAPTSQTVNQALSGPGAVQAVSVIGNQLLLIHDAGQGLDSSSQTYDLPSLAGPKANAPGTAGSNRAIASLAGPVDLAPAQAPGCPAGDCVGRYDLTTGALSDVVAYPQGTRLGPLLGPYPAVIVLPSSGPAYVDRIG